MANKNKTYLLPPKITRNPGNEYAKSTRTFQGVPSLAISPNGRLWASWYAGKTHDGDKHNYVIVATSEDKGETWEETLFIIPTDDENVRAFDPELWVDPTGRLWSFWAQTIGHDGTIASVWAITTDNPGTKNPDWSKPRRIISGIMMCKPIVLSNDDWLLPVSIWKTERSAKVVISKNQGKDWNVRGACHIPNEIQDYDEHILVERKDGSLWMLVRTTYGIGESQSLDLGSTWSPIKPSGIMHPNSRFFLIRLNSGNLLLVKHGPIDKKVGREQLMAFVSTDDGESWTDGVVLDSRRDVSYPDGQQGADGVIYVIYDFSRKNEKEILLAMFTEDDILNDRYKSSTFSTKILVAKA